MSVKKRIGIIIVIILALLSIIVLHTALWPNLLKRISGAIAEGTNWSNIRLCLTMDDELNKICRPHAVELMKADTLLQAKAINPKDLKSLLELPGVLDVFYLDLIAESGEVLNQTIPVDTLINSLKLLNKKWGGGSSQMMRRLIGGLTRFKTVKSNSIKHSLLVRYVGDYYPANSTIIIGLVLNKEWFINQVNPTLVSCQPSSVG